MMGKKTSSSVSRSPKASIQRNFTDSPEKEREADDIAQGIHAMDIEESNDSLAGDEVSVVSSTLLDVLQSPSVPTLSVASNSGMHVSVCMFACIPPN